jgi:hypothetical protein
MKKLNQSRTVWVTSNLYMSMRQYTAEMETEPDVRVYLWLVGQATRGNEEQSPPALLQERQVWEAQLVREGRLYLKQAIEAGKGSVLLSPVFDNI